MTVGSFIDCVDRDYGAVLSEQVLKQLKNPDRGEQRSFDVLMKALEAALRGNAEGKPPLPVMGKPTNSRGDIRGRLIFQD